MPAGVRLGHRVDNCGHASRSCQASVWTTVDMPAGVLSGQVDMPAAVLSGQCVDMLQCVDNCGHASRSSVRPPCGQLWTCQEQFCQATVWITVDMPAAVLSGQCEDNCGHATVCGQLDMLGAVLSGQCVDNCGHASSSSARPVSLSREKGLPLKGDHPISCGHARRSSVRPVSIS